MYFSNWPQYLYMSHLKREILKLFAIIQSNVWYEIICFVTQGFSKYLQDLFSRQNVKVWKFSLLLFVFSMRLSVPKKWYNKRKLKNQMVAIKTCLTFLIKYADYLSFPFILLYFLKGTRSFFITIFGNPFPPSPATSFFNDP